MRSETNIGICSTQALTVFIPSSMLSIWMKHSRTGKLTKHFCIFADQNRPITFVQWANRKKNGSLIEANRNETNIHTHTQLTLFQFWMNTNENSDDKIAAKRLTFFCVCARVMRERERERKKKVQPKCVRCSRWDKIMIQPTVIFENSSS